MATLQGCLDLNRFVASAGPYRELGFATLNGVDFLRRSVEEIEQYTDVSSTSPLPYIRVEPVYYLVLELRHWLQRTDIGITVADTISSGYLDLMTWLTCRAWYFYNYDILWRNLFGICMGESRRIQRELWDPDTAALPENLVNASDNCFSRIELVSSSTDGYDSDSTDNPFYLHHEETRYDYVQYRFALRRDASRHLLLLIQWLQNNGHRQLYIDFLCWMESSFLTGMSPLRPMRRFCAEDVLMCRMPFEMAALEPPGADERFDMGWLEVDTFDYLQFLNAAPAHAARNVVPLGWLPPGTFL